ncbi:hypothetical protein ACH4VM_18705 [Streptomyces sp. NPDC020792]|uniref:hypothetical protein n=1 Tax=Streptomyces sp. NPDC020792 TaxID=3365089 RepID=UPI0037BB5684
MLPAADAAGTSDAAGTFDAGIGPPGFLLVGAGVGPMSVAIDVAATGDVPAKGSGPSSRLTMTGHEIGATLGVAGPTATAGDLATQAGLIDGYDRAFAVPVAVLAALLVLTALAVPRGKPRATVSSHGTHRPRPGRPRRKTRRFPR